MLNDNQIDDLIQPIVNRQQAINTYVIQKIAKRVKDIGELLPSDVNMLQQLYLNSQDIREINETIAEIAGLQVIQIKGLIKEVAQDAYKDAKPLYDYRQKPYIPYKENKQLQRIVKAISNQTANEYTNMSKAQAFMMRNPRNRKMFIPTTIAKTYQNIVDTAIQATQQGVVDYNTAMKQALKDLNDSGIKFVQYETESGRIYYQSVESAVRRNLLDGVRAINLQVQEEIGKQIDADGKEITVHINSAPDHEPIQGHQFTNEEFEKLQNAETFQDVEGRNFSPIERAIGTLNCRHFTYSIIVGFTKPNFTTEQLDKMIEKNHKGYTNKDGKHFTLYECSQVQREYERKIRKAKTGEKMAKQAGNEKLADEYHAKQNKLLNMYKQFSDACGLKIKPDRLVIQ